VIFDSAQEILYRAVTTILLMPLAGFPGAVLLNWSELLLDLTPTRYWMAYKVTTIASMAAVVFLVPLQLISQHFGGFGLVVDVVSSVFVMGLFYATWIRDEEGHSLGFEDGFWLSALQSGLCLLIVGVFYGLSAALTPSGRLLGLVGAVGCAGLLVSVAAISLKRQSTPRAVSVVAPTWKTDDILALYRHAADEFDKGHRDDELWSLAALAKSDAAQQREWYLAERVKQLREIAETQLRREGLI
jgi:hypothetical protein